MNKEYTKDQWLEEGKNRFGEDFINWKFICPRCGNIASGEDFKKLGATPNDIYCNCIGRYDKNKGCDWAAYGLLDICTVHVDGQPVFDFAPLDSERPTRKEAEGK